LQWRASAGATHYNIYRNGTKIGSVPADTTTYTDKGVQEGSYTYYVTAANDVGESKHSPTAVVLVDRTAPKITYTVSPTPNSNGWNNSDVKVTFTCSDESSGIDSCTKPVTVNTEGTDQKVKGTATDKAGNTASVTATINIDKTAPDITYSVSPAPNSNGWIEGDVTVTFSCSDELSGIASCPDPVTVAQEGADQKVKGTATDKAGNSATATATVNIDKTAPTISYSVDPAPNGNGWNSSDVTVTFHCDDDLSGIASCPDSVTVSQEGGGQKITGTATDKAGNSASTTATVNLDKTKPSISYQLDPAPNTNGWNNSNVKVTFSCADELSGVVNCPDPVTISQEGTDQKVTGTATDKAGNSASTTATVNLDKTAPTISYTIAPVPNSNGWNNTAVKVTFTCDDEGSGIVSCTDPVTVTTDGADQKVTGTATDKAGNTASIAATVNIDKTAPDITYSLSPAPNSSGWNDGDVTVAFSCADELSGVASCPDPVTVSQESANQKVKGTATDEAGNSATATATVNIDKTAPTISYKLSPAPNSNGWNNSDVTVSFTCNDALSGIASCTSPQTISTEGANQTVTGTAIDKAGNKTNVTATVNLDKTKPTISNPSMSNTFIVGSANETISASASDSLSGISGGEFYIDTDPGKGNGMPMTYDNGTLTNKNGVTISAQSLGQTALIAQHTLYIRVKDKAGNWKQAQPINFIVINLPLYQQKKANSNLGNLSPATQKRIEAALKQ
jgi:hypothetical protein